MKFKNALIFSLIFMLLYVVLTVLISFFTFSFGYSEPNKFYSVLRFFISFPINPDEGINSRLFFLILLFNGFVWGIIFWTVIFFSRKLLLKK